VVSKHKGLGGEDPRTTGTQSAADQQAERRGKGGREIGITTVYTPIKMLLDSKENFGRVLAGAPAAKHASQLYDNVNWLLRGEAFFKPR